MGGIVNERELIRRLLDQVKAAGTKAGHKAIKTETEHLGVCNTRLHYTGGRVERGITVDQVLVGECAPSCQEWRAVVADAERYLDETASAEPVRIAVRRAAS